ncbi:MAG: nucleotide exchange factor GrpE [Candidatus Omnitrophica bacterium]|nr:nucleotide exchange factor GrpE [Candidatus Omnitrophota bacterium]
MGKKDRCKSMQEKENSPEEKPEAVEAMVTIKQAELEALKAQLAECQNGTLRLYADFENTRKRMERDKQEFVKYANEKVIVEFLNILDDLERSVLVARSKHQDYENFLKGVEMIMSRILDMLKKHGVKSMEVVPGLSFDPHCHEVLMQEATNEMPDGSVMEELQKGYYLGDRVVRTAKVKVAKEKTE